MKLFIIGWRAFCVSFDAKKGEGKTQKVADMTRIVSGTMGELPGKYAFDYS
jgi:hypothetical protein